MKPLFKTIAILLLTGGMLASQFFYDRAEGRSTYFEPDVLNAKALKAVDLGLHNAVSDMMWLTAIQYLGGGQSKGYQKLDDYLYAAVDLDPKFSYPYAFGVLMLPNFGMVDKGIELAERGLRDANPDWQIPYYLAVTYHLSKNDRAKAAEFFNVAANTSGAPSNIKAIAARYGSRSDIREQTIQIWTGIYETTNDDVVKEQAKNYILHYELLNFLEKAATSYKDKNGSYPANLSDLVSGQILREIPSDPLGFGLTIDQATGKVNIDK